ncbi:MAG: SGNH/GDSL hydrolase family protein [Planctomycetes bacterium]|nr:SGNH/GDSL hydrolase family protein [Planctomycetota bacterium]
MTKKLIYAIILSVSLAGNYLLYKANMKTAYMFKKVKIDPIGMNNKPLASGKHRFLVYGSSHAQNWKSFPYEHVNLGVGGQTSAQLSIRQHYQFDNFHADYSVIFAGGNDCKAVAFAPSLKDKVIESTVANIQKMISDMPSDKVIMSTIPPVFKAPLRYLAVDMAEAQDAIEQINERMRSMASANVLILDSHKIFLDQYNLSNFSTDGIHMNSQGYELLNEELAKLIKRNARE